ncbi:GGDEF domain-containing protein [Haploplasma axanthum]|uniref:Probable diguanylate cyclase AdrA n=1 Tax=Haploplasma axanthum TaxID=29552 RepID=A0A449BEQ3_HAPAX|nr:GGDEF domain-containing protein [Haploplasma axanthum]VEU80902.1 Probable diguanylate cyclase AdrA [Haploplasma axanthum]
MKITHQIDINLFMIFCIIILLIIAKFTLDKKNILTKTFFSMAIITLTQLSLESIATVLDGAPGKIIGPLLYFIYIVMFILSIFLSLYWYLIMKRFFKIKNDVYKTIEKILFVIQLINIIVIILTPLTKAVFYIDSNNMYNRGKLFINQTFAIYYYPIFATIILLVERKKLESNDFVLLLLSMCIPVIGGIAQAIFYGYLIIWPTTAFSLILTYIFIKQKMIQYDALTGVWNRGSLFEYVKQRFNLDEKNIFGALYFDIDCLKQINDQYGHSAGDRAIVEITVIIKKIVGNNVVARLGGDEFISILDVATNEELNVYSTKIKEEINEFNKKNILPYLITVSIGGDIFDSKFKNFDNFLHHIDILMYQDKSLNHREINK